MAGSLFDQLKKAGLVDEKKAKKAKQEKYQQTKQQKGKKSKQVAQPDAAKLAAQQAQAEKAQRDRELNQQRQQEQAAKAEAAAVRQLIESNMLKEIDGEVVYHFTDGNKVKSLYVTEEIHQQLSNGRLRIARYNDSYALLPKQAAEKVTQRNADTIIPMPASDEKKADEDDYYAKFEVPDDLMW